MSGSATISASNQSLSLAGGGSFIINGSNDTVTVAAGDTVTATGVNDTITFQGGGTLNLGSAATSATVNGDNAIVWMNGGGGTLTANGNGDTVTGGSNASITLNGSDTAGAGAGSTVTANGGYDIIYGTQATIQADNQNGTTVVFGSGNTTSLNMSGQTVTDDGSGDTVFGVNSGDTLNLGTPQGISANVVVTVSGSGGTVSNDNASDAVYTLADTSLTVTGSGGAIVLNGNNDSVATNNETVYTGLSVANLMVTGSGDTLDEWSNVQADIAGNNDFVAMQGNADSIGLLGGNNDTVAMQGSNESATVIDAGGYTIDGDDAADFVTLLADTSATVTGSGGWVLLNGSNDSVATNNETVYTGLSVANLTVTGSGDTLDEWSNVQADIAGSDDFVAMQGNADSIGLLGGNNDTVAMQGSNEYAALTNGSSYTVNGDTAGDTVNLGDGADAAVTGSGGAVGLLSSNDTVTTSNQTVTVLGGLQSLTVAGNGDSIDLVGGDTSVTASGNSDTVYSVDGNTIGFSGTGDTVQVNDGQVYLDTPGTSVTVVRNNDTANAATGGDTLGFAGAADTAQIANGQVYLDTAGTSVTVEGDGNTVNTPQSDTVVGFTGINNVAQVSNGTIVVNNESGPSLAVEGSGDAVTTVGGGTVASPVLDDATAGDIDAIYNAVLDRDPSASDYVAAQVLLAGGGGLGSLMAAVAGSAESAADMASTYAAVGEAAPSEAEFGAFADAMSGSYGAPIEVFSVDPVSGAQVVLADTSVTNLLAELPVLETEANGVNLGLQLADGAQIGFSSTARLADFLYAVSVQQLQATSFVTDNYNLDMQWLDTVDEPLLNEAVSWSEQAANETAAGGAYETSLADENNAQASLALKIAAEAPGSRQDMSVTISNPYTGNPTQVTVYAGGGDKVHDIAPGIGGILESIASIVVNVAAAVFQQPELYLAAAAIDATQAGQDFSNGEDLQGILSVAQALSAGITADVGVPAQGVAATAAQVTAQAINIASQAVGGVYGIVQSAENGDGAGIFAGALEAAAAGAAGIGLYAGGQTQTVLQPISKVLTTAGVLTTIGSDFASGNLGQGLLDSLNLFLPALADDYVASQASITPGSVAVNNISPTLDMLGTPQHLAFIGGFFDYTESLLLGPNAQTTYNEYLQYKAWGRARR